MLLDTCLWLEIIKEIIPLIFDAHQLGCALTHNCAVRVLAHFKNINEVIATIKAGTIKNKDCRKNFHGLPSSPSFVLQDGRLGLELHYISVRTFQLFVPLPTIGQVQAS